MPNKEHQGWHASQLHAGCSSSLLRPCQLDRHHGVRARIVIMGLSLVSSSWVARHHGVVARVAVVMVPPGGADSDHGGTKMIHQCCPMHRSVWPGPAVVPPAVAFDRVISNVGEAAWQNDQAIAGAVFRRGSGPWPV